VKTTKIASPTRSTMSIVVGFPARAHLRKRIVKRVAAGEWIARICLSADMPTAATVQVWRQADASFPEPWLEARRRGVPTLLTVSSV
jgi:hypothetical protein